MCKKEFECPYCEKKYTTNRGRNTHCRSTHGKITEEIYLTLFHGDARPTCQCGCGGDVEFESWSRGFRNYTNTDHYYKHLSEEGNETKTCLNDGCDNTFTSRKSRNQRYCSQSCSSQHLKTIENTKNYVLDTYGVDNISKTDFFKNKMIELNQERYGVDCAFQAEEVKEKILATKLERYDDELYNNREKERATKLEKYGDSEYCNVEQIIKTNQERYGANSFTCTEEGKNKVLETVKDRYGDEYTSTLQVPFIKEKIKKVNIEKYGTPYPVRLPSVKKKVRETHFKTFFKRLLNSDRLNDKYTPLFTIDDYNGVEEEYKFMCNSCGDTVISHLNNAKIPRCFRCEPVRFHNKENEIHDFLLTIFDSTEIITRNRKILGGLELDFYIPSEKIAIEFDGLYWHSEIGGKKDKEYHLNKTKLCEDEGIRLIHIFEDEWDLNQSLIKNKLKYIFGKYEGKKVYGRKCNIKEISPKIKNEFLNEYHIQGEDRSNVKLGLFHEDELVSVMTYSLERIALGGTPKKDNFELSRYASKYSVLGGFSKLFSHFIKNYNPTKIITYADLRWSSINGTVYENVNMKLDKITSPNYWYMKNHNSREYRFKYRKSELEDKLEIFDSELTEWENMQLNSYDRIWDCGHLKYVWEK